MPVLKNKTQGRYINVYAGIPHDTNLSLKDRGMLLTLLSLPDNWKFSIKGLRKIIPDSENSINASLIRLEKMGYITRSRERTAGGKLGASVVEVHERPHLENPDVVKPDVEKPHLENPDVVKPDVEKPRQSIIQESNIQESNIYISNIQESNNRLDINTTTTTNAAAANSDINNIINNINNMPYGNIVSGGDCSCPDAAAAVGSQRNIFALYESTGRQLNSLTAETLIDLEATYGEEWVCEAIKRANDRGRVNIGYIKGILDSWRAGGGIDNPDRDKTPSGRKMTKAEQDFNKSINMLKEWAEK